MRRLLLLAACLGALLVPAAVQAHPLGNFTVNRHTTIELSGGRIYVHYALDVAEIPTVQLGDSIRRPGFAAEAARRLDLRVDGRRAPLRVLEHRAEVRPGAGGLMTLRFDAVYATTATGSALAFRDANFGERIGWKEVVVHASAGAKVVDTTAPAESRSDELRNYPKDLLGSPPDVTTASARFGLGSGPGAPPAIVGPAAAKHAGGGFEALVSRGDLSVGVVLVSLLVAAFWGAAHALTPGHGKAVVAGYMVGTRGRPRDAFLLGGIVTVTHTIGVFTLGLVTLGLSELFVPEDLYPWLNLISAVLVVAVGLAVLRARIRSVSRHAHHHHHAHDHDHGHGHSHVPAPGSGLRGLVAVGVSGGILPCPTALVVLLAAISLHRVAFGLLLIVAFSLGLAAVVTGIGLLAIGAQKTFSRLSLDGPVVRALPAVSALLILGVGLVMTVRALPSVV
jgi:nickel/cobalt transporter (NicO) family protein